MKQASRAPGRLLSALLTLTSLGAAAPARSGPIVVTTTSELEAALTPANAGKRILIRAGDYELGQALTVPDDATLVGEGVMSFDEAGLPTGFKPSGRTVIRSTPALDGDILTLGDGATLQSLVIEDVVGRQSGNPVAVVSRAAGDFVSARIKECEIVNPNPLGRTPRGPTGRGVAVYTPNPNLNFDPPPHDGAAVRLQMTRSIVRSQAAGNGIFAINFASHADIDVDLEGNVIGGGLDLAGGVSRPDGVTGSRTIIQSRRNLYRSDSSAPAAPGWNLVGGVTAPLPGLVSQASTFNSLRLHSTGDRIEGFAQGVFAAGSMRTSPLPEPSSSNRVEMNLHDLSIRTTASPTSSDLVLFGAQSLVDGVSPGDGNSVRLLLKKSTGSGPRANIYADSSMDLGVDNRLEIVGTEKVFVRSNDGFDPIPPTEFFYEP